MPSVPYELRNQTFDFKTRFGEVFTEYNKLSFDKERAFKEQAIDPSRGVKARLWNAYFGT